MKVELTLEQAQRLVLLHREFNAANARLIEAVQTLAPGIENATLHNEEDQWYLTNEVEAVEE